MSKLTKPQRNAKLRQLKELIRETELIEELERELFQEWRTGEYDDDLEYVSEALYKLMDKLDMIGNDDA